MNQISLPPAGVDRSCGVVLPCEDPEKNEVRVICLPVEGVLGLFPDPLVLLGMFFGVGPAFSRFSFSDIASAVTEASLPPPLVMLTKYTLRPR